jgi:hypothetical protein
MVLICFHFILYFNFSQTIIHSFLVLYELMHFHIALLPDSQPVFVYEEWEICL